MVALPALSRLANLQQVIAALNNLMGLFGTGGLVDLGGPTTWTGLVYTSPWGDIGAGWPTAAWWKDPFGVVHLRGVAYRGSGSSVADETIATLPAGARPPIREMATAMTNSATAARLDILSDGTIRWEQGVVATPWVTLGCITFRTT